ncbi:hypothetical protein LPW11_21010 [Geomonas sp. RF6]|uniref:hypothetical protein n=1 Tax=Geomonas sp. RF6 TaxID=2897342 RepID=UPI001E433867|nr:hypothetical protein [Geomonas sp. RF6]UFS70338.1 hypothetical protein LPW11_21010 [Geomonas sp. RF6]
MVVTEQKTGALAVASLIAAFLSFFLTFAGHGILAVVCGVLAIPLGGIGLMMAASPRVGGGIMSIAGIILGVIAIGVAVLGGVGRTLF